MNFVVSDPLHVPLQHCRTPCRATWFSRTVGNSSSSKCAILMQGTLICFLRCLPPCSQTDVSSRLGKHRKSMVVRYATFTSQFISTFVCVDMPWSRWKICFNIFALMRYACVDTPFSAIYNTNLKIRQSLVSAVTISRMCGKSKTPVSSTCSTLSNAQEFANVKNSFPNLTDWIQVEKERERN